MRAGLAYAIAALVFTFPLVLHPTSRLAALHGPGDPYLYVWILGWNLETLMVDPWAIVDGRIFDANIFHPARQTLAYSDHMLPQSLLLWPLYAFTRNAVLCYNVLFFGSLVGSALAMYAFARRLTGDALAAWIAGLAWGFWPFHFSHLAHLQLQGLYLLPLSFLFLHRLVSGGRRRDAVLLGVTAALQTMVSTYYGVIGAVGLGVAAITMLLVYRARSGIAVADTAGPPRPGRWGVFRQLLIAGLVGVVLLAPIALPYWQVQQREGFGRNLDEASRHAASAASYLSVAAMNAVYGRTGLLPIGSEEHGLFPGFTLTFLALAGLVIAVRTDRLALGAALTAVTVAGYVLSLGPDGLRVVYATLHRTLFGFHAIRAPARFSVLVTFGLATLAALAIAELSRRTAGRASLGRAAAGLVVALIAVEYLNAPISYAEAPATRTAAGAWLRDEPIPGAVLYLPLALDAPNTTFMVESLQHRRPIVNGASGHRPGFFTALVDTMSTFPDAESLWMLRELDVRFVVAPEVIAGGEQVLVPRAVLGEEHARPDRHIYEVRWSPEAEAALEEAAVVPPPDPGPPPFAIGEHAEYDVRWLGAGASLSAGTITIGVTAPPEGSGALYQFEATATTADWVSRFFEARDRFETTADDRLRPVVHERAIREGRRRLDRAARFDHEARLVAVSQTTDGRDVIEHRIPPGTRDAVTAFFYLRSLDLATIDELQLPINEVGRNQVLIVRRAERETIEHEGESRAAVRLEPDIVQRVTRRAPVDITVWLSDDARKIPLRFEVSGAFGTVRAILAAYRPGG